MEGRRGGRLSCVWVGGARGWMRRGEARRGGAGRGGTGRDGYRNRGEAALGCGEGCGVGGNVADLGARVRKLGGV